MPVPRFLRFRLRTLFLLITLVSPLLGWYVANARQHGLEINAIRFWNGDLTDFSVHVRPNDDRTTCASGVNVFAEVKWQGPAWLRQPIVAIGPPILDRVKMITLLWKDCGDEEIAKFESFPQLDLIVLVGTNISPLGRQRLREIFPAAQVVYSAPAEPQPLAPSNARVTLESIRPPQMYVDEPDGTSTPVDTPSIFSR